MADLLTTYVVLAPDGTEHQILATSPRRAIKQIVPHAEYPCSTTHDAPRWHVRYARFAPLPCWAFVE